MFLCRFIYVMQTFLDFIANRNVRDGDLLIFPFETHRNKNQQLNIIFVVTRLFLLSYAYSSFRIFLSDRPKENKKLTIEIKCNNHAEERSLGIRFTLFRGK